MNLGSAVAQGDIEQVQTWPRLGGQRRGRHFMQAPFSATSGTFRMLFHLIRLRTTFYK